MEQKDQIPKPVKPAKPVHELKIGAIKAAIWANDGPNGTWHSVTFCRLFKVGDEWNQIACFRRDDLLTLAKLADMSHSWMLTKEP